MNNTDAAGITKRYINEIYSYNGRKLIIVENKGLFVLCPCPDMLVVKYLDTEEIVSMENTENFIQEW